MRRIRLNAQTARNIQGGTFVDGKFLFRFSDLEIEISEEFLASLNRSLAKSRPPEVHVRPKGVAVDAAVNTALEVVVATMRERHYLRPFNHRTLECMEQHWDYDIYGGCQERPDCWREGTICNGCGTEECHELPAVLALIDFA